LFEREAVTLFESKAASALRFAAAVHSVPVSRLTISSRKVIQ